MSDEIKRKPAKPAELVVKEPEAIVFAGDPGSLEERRTQVFKLKLRGKSDQDIAKTLNLTLKVVQNDLEMVREQNRSIFQFDRQSLIQENLKGFDDLIERAWAEYETAPPKTMLKLKALDMARVARNDRAKFLQECGFIEVVEKKTEHKVQVDIINRWGDEDFRRAAAKALVASTFTPNLPEPVPLDEYLKQLEAEDASANENTEIIDVDSVPAKEPS